MARPRWQTLLGALACMVFGGLVTYAVMANLPAARESAAPTAAPPAPVPGQVLDLTFKEFELLKFLAQHPGRVFTRAQLLQEVWGYDYFGGTRTVDVHVRRLRAKLGPEHETVIGTVRNVGYRFVVPPREEPAPANAGA